MELKLYKYDHMEQNKIFNKYYTLPTYISARRYESYITKHAWIKMQKKTTIKSLRKLKMKPISTAVYSFCLFVESGYWDFQSKVVPPSFSSVL